MSPTSGQTMYNMTTTHNEIALCSALCSPPDGDELPPAPRRESQREHIIRLSAATWQLAGDYRTRRAPRVHTLAMHIHTFHINITFDTKNNTKIRTHFQTEYMIPLEHQQMKKVTQITEQVCPNKARHYSCRPTTTNYTLSDHFFGTHLIIVRLRDQVSKLYTTLACSLRLSTSSQEHWPYSDHNTLDDYGPFIHREQRTQGSL